MRGLATLVEIALLVIFTSLIGIAIYNYVYPMVAHEKPKSYSIIIMEQRSVLEPDSDNGGYRLIVEVNGINEGDAVAVLDGAAVIGINGSLIAGTTQGSTGTTGSSGTTSSGNGILTCVVCGTTVFPDTCNCTAMPVGGCYACTCYYICPPHTINPITVPGTPAGVSTNVELVPSSLRVAPNQNFQVTLIAHLDEAADYYVVALVFDVGGVRVPALTVAQPVKIS